MSFRRAFVLAYATLWALTFGVAALVLVAPGGPAFARGALRLSLSGSHNPAPGFGGVISIALNNTLHSVWPLLLGSIGAQRRRFTRALADVAVLANLLIAAMLVGEAFGGYGVRVLAFLPHVPLEWAGIAVGAAGWVVERARRLDGCPSGERGLDSCGPRRCGPDGCALGGRCADGGGLGGRGTAFAFALAASLLAVAAVMESFLVPTR